MRVTSIFCALGVMLSAAANAQTAAQTCAKMQAEGRLGPLTKQQCECNYAVALQVLDDDIQALLFDAWHNGTNNLDKIERLKPRARVERQLRKMANTAQRTCQ